MQLVLSLVGGLMLAVSLFVLFSHAVLELASLDRAVWWTLIGMLAMFFLIRAFHFHEHEVPAVALENRHDAQPEAHDHDHHALHDHFEHHPLSIVGLALGLGLHTLIDGIALAASVAAATHEDHGWQLLGFGTFLAVLLHKPLDSLSIISVMVAGGWSSRAQSLANAAFALICPAGAVLFVLSLDRLVFDQHVIVGCALGFSAGAFLCIALSDLLPEIQFHTHHRFKLSAMLLLGVAIGYGVSRLEAVHDHSNPAGDHGHSHDIDRHDAHEHAPVDRRR
jgi:zinc and cadmium transporter